jgi:hypothetical protein
MNGADYDSLVAETMTEKKLQDLVGRLARAHGWHVFHVTWSPGTTPGWPDCVLVHPGQGRTLFRELKTARGRLSTRQREWLDVLTRAGHDAGVWTTHDLTDGTIAAELTTLTRTGK